MGRNGRDAEVSSSLGFGPQIRPLAKPCRTWPPSSRNSNFFQPFSTWAISDAGAVEHRRDDAVLDAGSGAQLEVVGSCDNCIVRAADLASDRARRRRDTLRVSEPRLVSWIAEARIDRVENVFGVHAADYVIERVIAAPGKIFCNSFAGQVVWVTTIGGPPFGTGAVDAGLCVEPGLLRPKIGRAFCVKRVNIGRGRFIKFCCDRFTGSEINVVPWFDGFRAARCLWAAKVELRKIILLGEVPRKRSSDQCEHKSCQDERLGEPPAGRRGWRKRGSLPGAGRKLS